MPNYEIHKTATFHSLYEYRLREVEYIIKKQTARKITRYFQCGKNENYTPIYFTADTEFAGAKLVDQSPITHVDADLVQFARTYVEQPGTWSFPRKYIPVFPGLYGIRGPVNNRAVLARVQCDYFLTNDEATLPFVSGQRWLFPQDGAWWDSDPPELANAGGALADTDPTLTEYLGWMSASTEFVAEDCDFTEIAPFLWERQTIYVVAQ